jgi:hypothetical protein
MDNSNINWDGTLSNNRYLCDGSPGYVWVTIKGKAVHKNLSSGQEYIFGPNSLIKTETMPNGEYEVNVLEPLTAVCISQKNTTNSLANINLLHIHKNETEKVNKGALLFLVDGELEINTTVYSKPTKFKCTSDETTLTAKTDVLCLRFS